MMIKLSDLWWNYRSTTYPYGTNAVKVCKTEMLSKYK